MSHSNQDDDLYDTIELLAALGVAFVVPKLLLDQSVLAECESREGREQVRRTLEAVTAVQPGFHEIACLSADLGACGGASYVPMSDVDFALRRLDTAELSEVRRRYYSDIAVIESATTLRLDLLRRLAYLVDYQPPREAKDRHWIAPLPPLRIRAFDGLSGADMEAAARLLERLGELAARMGLASESFAEFVHKMVTCGEDRGPVPLLTPPGSMAPLVDELRHQAMLRGAAEAFCAAAEAARATAPASPESAPPRRRQIAL